MDVSLALLAPIVVRYQLVVIVNKRFEKKDNEPSIEINGKTPQLKLETMRQAEKFKVIKYTLRVIDLINASFVRHQLVAIKVPSAAIRSDLFRVDNVDCQILPRTFG
jgi:hypothetical protein